MANLTNIAKTASLSFSLKTPIVVTRGGSFIKAAKDLETLSEYKDQLTEKSGIKKYLLKDINELNHLRDFIENEVNLDKLDTLLSNTKMYEKISSFDENVIKKTLKGYGCEYVLYLTMYMHRLAKLHNIAMPNVYNINRLLNEVDGITTFYEKFMEVPEEQLLPLFSIDDFCINGEKTKEVMALLNDPNYVALVRYITQYHYLSSNVLEGIDCKKTLHLLNKIYLQKIRCFFINDETRAKEEMETLVSLAYETNFDNKFLQGFFNNVTLEFFDGTKDIISYMNVALCNKYNNIIENAPRVNSMSNLLIYALKNKKFAFLKLLDENVELVNKTNQFNNYLVSTCLLTMPRTYEKLINLNEINKDDLEKLIHLGKKDINIDTRLTPKELIAIAKSPISGIEKLYNLLTCKVDTKLIILRQLANTDYSFKYINEVELNRIANKLSAKNLAQRIGKMDVDYETMLNILSLDKTFDNIVSEATNQLEFNFIFRNRETIDLDKSLEENFEQYIDNDIDCKKMFEVMNLSREFLETHKENIKHFCLLGNATIVMTYYNGQTGAQKQNILTIAKAEMAGEMTRFKFHDLDKELEYALSSNEKDLWMENTTRNVGNNFVYETFSFNDTMLIGEKPNHSCMNYKDGSYNECLLANFDSNKKIVFVKNNGKIVGRAIIRLTKSLNQDENLNTKVSFLDVENNVVENNNGKAIERLTIFLERPYFAHINSAEERKIKKSICNLIATKAEQLNARFLASTDYGDCDLNRTTMRVFISHTKNDVQYMDSFGGRNGLSNEASYKSCSCYEL